VRDDDDDLWVDGPDLLGGPPRSTRSRRKGTGKKKLFVMLPYPAALLWPIKLGRAGLVVLMYLVHEKWRREQNGKDPRKIPVSSQTLCKAGVSRYVKRRGLRQLRSIKWIQDVGNGPGCNPVVRLTLPVTKSPR